MYMYNVILKTMSPCKTQPQYCISFSLSLSLHAGNEEDHDNDRGGWPRAGGLLVHVSVPQVCAGSHSDYRV